MKREKENEKNVIYSKKDSKKSLDEIQEKKRPFKRKLLDEKV